MKHMTKLALCAQLAVATGPCWATSSSTPEVGGPKTEVTCLLATPDGHYARLATGAGPNRDAALADLGQKDPEAGAAAAEDRCIHVVPGVGLRSHLPSYDEQVKDPGLTMISRTKQMSVWLIEIGAEGSGSNAAGLIKRFASTAPESKDRIETFVRQIADAGLLKEYRYAVVSGDTDHDIPVFSATSHEVPLSIAERADNVWHMLTTGAEAHPSSVSSGIKAILRPRDHALAYRIQASWEDGEDQAKIVSADEEGDAPLNPDQVLVVPLKGHPLVDDPHIVTLALLTASPLAPH